LASSNRIKVLKSNWGVAVTTVQDNKKVVEGKIIEINGKLYDSYGQLVTNESGAISATKTPTKINDITRSRQTSIPIQKAQPKKNRPAHAPPNNKKRSVQRSSTLIRKAVKKPNLSKDNIGISAKSVALSPVSSQKLESRILRSRSAEKSPLITRFSRNSSMSYIQEVNQYPISKNPLVNSEPPKPIAKKRYNPFDDAVERAQPTTKHSVAKKTKKPYISTTTMSGILFIIVGTIILLIAMPNLNARYVAYRSGVNVILPRTIPTGYKFDSNIAYSAGTMTLNYINGTNNFKLIEQIDLNLKSSGLRNITESTKSKSSVYAWTKNNIDFFLVTNNVLSQYDIDNIYAST